MTQQDLQKLVAKYEQLVGIYSKKSKIVDANDDHGHAEDIPLTQRPSYQFLKALGVTVSSHEPLSTQKENLDLTPKVDKAIEIKPFSLTKTFKDTGITTISPDRQQELLNSAKVYLNTDIITKEIYLWAKNRKIVRLDENTVCDKNGEYWQNLAAGGICFAQKIDSFYIALQGTDNVATFHPTPARTIEKGMPAVLLLSTPRLQFGGILDIKTADHLTPTKQTEYIKAMYRNVFNAALNEGYKYIAMAAVGFGSSGGEPHQYFEALMTVAREFPDLNIIYNPNKYASDFKSAVDKAKPQNICQTKMDMAAFSLKHTADGFPTALVDICDSDAVYGLRDFGGKWKKERHLIGHSVFSFLAYMTTLILNSFGINPKAFENIEEYSHSASQAKKTTTNTINKPDTPPEPTKVIEVAIPSTTDTTTIIPKQPSSLTDPSIPTTTSNPEAPPINKSEDKGKFFSPIEKPPTPTPSQSRTTSLTQEQLNEIHAIRTQLEKEIASCWPYPNKDRKQIKMDALTMLINEAEKLSLVEALDKVLQEHPEAIYGYISTRTADLFIKLRESTYSQLCVH